METKKNPKADLGRTRGLFLNVGLLVSLLLVTLAFEWRSYDDGPGGLGTLEDEFDEELDVPLTQQPPPPPPKQIIPPEIIEVPDEEEIEDEVIDLDIDLSEDMAVEEIVYEEEEENIDEILTIVEEKGVPKGGMGAFRKWIGKNIRYPDQAKRMGLEGKVYVNFVIERDGSLSNIQVQRGIGRSCDEEAKRVLKSYPHKWTPARQRGRPVRYRVSMPIEFRLHSKRGRR